MTDAICPVCQKTFEKNNHRQIYCSPEHQLIASLLRQKKLTDERRKSVNKTCFWCHGAIEPTATPQPKYCSKACENSFKTIKNRIFSIYPFDTDSRTKEILRLKELGNKYTFPLPHQKFNKYYGLGDEK